MSFEDRLKSLVEKHSNLGEKLAQGANVLGNEFSSISKEYSYLTPIVELINTLWASQKEALDLEAIINSKESDAEFKQMARDEAPIIRDNIEKITNDIKIALLPKDEDDDKSAILEIRAGTGGDEAALFVGDLFRMYTRYSELNKWKLELMSTNAIGIGGYKEVIMLVNGKGVFAKLKYESGIHRVQRVPETEAKGRVHTSAVSVAVLPEVEEVDMNIEDKDLRIDIYRASGAGGQHVNTTESAVRITHIPTGIVVAQQDERSQHKNKAKAMKILASRLYEHQRREIEEKRSADRKSQVGSGDRSEKIRTYNFPQGRITDHRINLTLYKLDRFMEGDIEEVLQALIANDQAEKLSYIED